MPIPAAALRRIARSKTTIAALLMDQQVLAGIGNVYRAELLYRHRVDPFLPGTPLDPAVGPRCGPTCGALMASGVRTGRIVTVRPEDRARKRGVLNREEAVYVYRRAGLPCRICDTEIRTRCWSAAICSGARPARRLPDRSGWRYRRTMSRMPAMISTLAVAAAMAGKPYTSQFVAASMSTPRSCNPPERKYSEMPAPRE